MDTKDEIKQHAAIEAIRFVQPGLTIGIGTGSTVYWFIQELAKKVKQGLACRCVPTSTGSKQLAEKLGKIVTSSYTPEIPTLSERIAKLQYNDDTESHITLNDKSSEFMKKLILLCPTKCYSLEGKNVVLQHEGCVECGTCSIGTTWRHPKGEKGIRYRYG